LANIQPTFNNTHGLKRPSSTPNVNKNHFQKNSYTAEHKHLGIKLLKLVEKDNKRKVLDKYAPKTLKMGAKLSSNRRAKKEVTIDEHRLELYHCYKKLNNMYTEKSESDLRKDQEDQENQGEQENHETQDYSHGNTQELHSSYNNNNSSLQLMSAQNPTNSQCLDQTDQPRDLRDSTIKRE